VTEFYKKSAETLFVHASASEVRVGTRLVLAFPKNFDLTTTKDKRQPHQSNLG